jgi:tRNA(fMet)-specific endonuclease VapC
MSGRYLLDTNIIIAFFKNDENVQNRLAVLADVFVPVIALGELYYGAKHSTQVDKHTQQVQDFADGASLLLCDSSTAEVYGQIKNELKTKGNPIPENDIWIAAIARQHHLTVVTRDQHFKLIDALPIEEW